MITAVSAHSTLLPWRELDDKSGVPIQSIAMYCLRVEKNNNPLEDAGIFKSINIPGAPMTSIFEGPTPPKKNKA